MKRHIFTNVRLSTLAVAVTYALYGAGNAWAKEQAEPVPLATSTHQSVILGSGAGATLNVQRNERPSQPSQSKQAQAPSQYQAPTQDKAAQAQVTPAQAQPQVAPSQAKVTPIQAQAAQSGSPVHKTSQSFAVNQPVTINATPVANNTQAVQPQTKPKRDPLSDGAKRLQATTNFATDVYRLMVNNPTSERYLQNSHVSATSTFPLRLFERLQQNPWQPAPFMPVPDKDLSCYYGIPPYKEPLNYDPKTTPIEIESDTVTGSIDEKVTYQGNVTITQGDKTLKADSTVYDYEQGKARADGNITFSSAEVTASTPAYIERNLETDHTVMYDTTFQMNGSVARGSSEKITLDSNPNRTVLENLSFTTCPVGDNSWHIEADSVELEEHGYFGESYGTTLYIKDVPVFYLPYANFPITNKRKSGLLYPSLSVSSDAGFDYEQPIYWNIAPNYDYTFSPRYMSKRGVLLGNEFRYMPFAGTEGSLTLDYLPHDSDWSAADDSSEHERYMFSWQQRSGFMHDDLVFELDYKRVKNNDYDYINDIGIPDADVTDDHLKQSFIATYDRPSYNLQLEVRDYQRLIPDDAVVYRPFAMLPQLSMNYYETYDAFTFNISGNATNFSSSSDADYDSFNTTRLHIEPEISYLMFNTRGTSVTASARGFFTSYNQDNLSRMSESYQEHLGFDSLASSKTRSLYLLQLQGKTTLERKVLDLRHTQTLEPEIMYQYIPYENQDDIGLYDTTNRMTDYYSSFSHRYFTGYDRIADLNRVSVGLTSRLLDAHDRELMRVGIAQTYSFVPTRVTLSPIDNPDSYTTDPLSVFFNANPIPEITTHASVSYNNDDNSVSAWNGMMQYKNENGYMVQVSYRFADQGNHTLSYKPIDLNQLGVLAQVPLSRKMRFAVATYQDLEQGENINTKVALRWEECCWSLALVYENYNQTNWNSFSRDEDHRIGIEFEFKGVGAVNITGSNDDDDADTHLLKYFNPTNLNQ